MSKKYSVHRNIKTLTATALTAASLFITGCSSAPKRPMQVSTIYTSSKEMIESANSCILSGDFDRAILFLSTSETQAMSIDNYDLLTAVALTKCSLALSQNPPQPEKATFENQIAKSYAGFCKNPKKQEALVALNEVRIAIADENSTSTDYKKLLAKLEDNQKNVKGDPYYENQFLTVKGDLYKLMKNYTEADKVFTTAAQNFTKNFYLTEIGMCWYKAAQARSLGGYKDSAIEALDKAIQYDRDAENSLALGTDYYALGLILLKAPATAADKEKAIYAFNHSADIFEAINEASLAQKSRDAANE